MSHGEAVLIVATGDLEDVALVLVAQTVALQLLAHALLDEVHVLLVVVDLDRLLSARQRVGDIEFHNLYYLNKKSIKRARNALGSIKSYGSPSGSSGRSPRSP